MAKQLFEVPDRADPADAAAAAKVVSRVPLGCWVDGTVLPGPRSLVVRDPANAAQLATVPAAGPDQLERALSAAAAAGPAWAARPARERAEVLRRCFDLMTREADDLALLMCLENGKTLADARAEVGYAAEFVRWFAEEAPRLGGELRPAPAGGSRLLVRHVPVGVALLLTPWNFPAAMVTRKLAPALAAGCSVVLKPAETTPLTALLLGELFTEAGVPPGVVNVVPTDEPGWLAEQALADPRVRKLSFTGSTPVGSSLMAAAARRIISPSLELGGNAPFVVLADADLDTAIRGAVIAKLRGSGQACTAANRFLVHTSVHDEFVDRLGAELAALVPGHGSDPRTTLSPLFHRRAVGRLADLVADASGSGASTLIGGPAGNPPGAFFPATLLTGVAADARVVTEEIFGPVAAIRAFSDEDEAVRLSNEGELGLSSYVFSRDEAHAIAFGSRLEVGMVGVNRGLVSEVSAPFGGVKQSGLGREGGHEGLLEFVEPVYFALDGDRS